MLNVLSWFSQTSSDLLPVTVLDKDNKFTDNILVLETVSKCFTFDILLSNKSYIYDYTGSL
jgi:hypothetical protein